MVYAFYHVPSIPEIESTTRYSHAVALAEHTDGATLITHEGPPDSIESYFDEVQVIDGSPLSIARQSAQVVSEASQTVESPLHVSTFHYEAALGGYLSDVPWVVDVYDDPIQYALNEPVSHHQLTARLLRILLGFADGGLHSYHPAAPRSFGKEHRFNLEGCPIDIFEPIYPDMDGVLRGVWAGSPRLDRGIDILFRGLSQSRHESVHVDIVGSISEQAKTLSHELGVDDLLTFHGSLPHEEVIEIVEASHIGFCVLPDRRDWQFATPLKVREYLSGGTIPVLSSFHGMRLLADRAGVYTNPSPEELATCLDTLSGFSERRLTELMREARTRAETNPLTEQREWFVRQAVSAGLGTEPFLSES